VFEKALKHIAELEVPQCLQKLGSFAVLKWCIRRWCKQPQWNRTALPLVL